MAISPSGRSDVYWVDGKLQIGDDCCGSSCETKKSSTRVSNLSFTLSDCRKCILKHNKDGNALIDIREYTRDRWGSENPSKVGVILSFDEFKKVRIAAEQIEVDLSKLKKKGSIKEEEIVGQYPLSEKHLLRTGFFKEPEGKKCIGVDLRESTTAGKPSSKGILLTVADWHAFKRKFASIEENKKID